MSLCSCVAYPRHICFSSDLAILSVGLLAARTL
jgi:hypothetical protein